MSRVFYFNPTCELAVANGSFSYMPPLLLQKMESDLSILPFIFATKNDFVLTENPPSVEFLKGLESAGFELPSFYTLRMLEAMPPDSFESIVPWGWSPAAHFKLQTLKAKCTEEFRHSPVFNWTHEQQVLYERSTALDFLHKILNNAPPPWFIEPERCGVKVGSSGEIEAMLKKHSGIVLKAPISSSGRGIQIIRNSSLNTSNRQWISGVLKQQKYLIAEPYLDKLLDLSFQFQVERNAKVTYLGISVFETNSNGQYQGTWIHPDFTALLPKADVLDWQDKIAETAHILREAIEKSAFAKDYRGYLGVDALIFRNQDQLRMQPCVEVNCRMNMGILSMKLENKIHQDARGKFELRHEKQNRIGNYMALNSKRNELKYLDGKIKSGFLALTEPHPTQKFSAYLSLDSPR